MRTSWLSKEPTFVHSCMSRCLWHWSHGHVNLIQSIIYYDYALIIGCLIYDIDNDDDSNNYKNNNNDDVVLPMKPTHAIMQKQLQSDQMNFLEVFIEFAQFKTKRVSNVLTWSKLKCYATYKHTCLRIKYHFNLWLRGATSAMNIVWI